MGGTVRWLDVNTTQWFYRNVLEAERIFLDSKKEEKLYSGKLYNKFVTGKTRSVHNFTTTEGQTRFNISGYKPDSREIVIVYIDGVPTKPSKLETDFVYIGHPIAGGKEVSVYLSGVLDMHQGDETSENCHIYPKTIGCQVLYPNKKLDMADKYEFDLRYGLNEMAVCMGQKLRRVNVDVQVGESIHSALMRTIGYKHNCFTIINGVLYVSFHLNQFPILVNYNYKSGAVIKNRQREKVVPSSTCAIYNDRFFPNITIPRFEFFSLLQRMRKNFYNRYTDRGYQPKVIDKTERYIKDREKFVGKWYEEDVVNILDEKFNDGCYVFPLYEDNTFQPDVCVTRAEAIVYLHRFTEWALEQFR
ncbi:hypothetical protein [Bacillus chungangensis]|uniref:SLH domain-containing protein n=1 Tax=Bacillus chungangensis TaxID=587633 RepID=A0ABT9WSM4_9BACI|nr:hypothetical protein [Bacillus chungangensis]MDQ0176232.1 hypothetical protein [Bacillus chungangensis]